MRVEAQLRLSEEIDKCGLSRETKRETSRLRRGLIGMSFKSIMRLEKLRRPILLKFREIMKSMSNLMDQDLFLRKKTSRRDILYSSKGFIQIKTCRIWTSTTSMCKAIHPRSEIKSTTCSSSNEPSKKAAPESIIFHKLGSHIIRINRSQIMNSKSQQFGEKNSSMKTTITPSPSASLKLVDQ